MQNLIILLVMLATSPGPVLAVGVCVGLATVAIMRLRKRQPLDRKLVQRYLVFPVVVTVVIWLISKVALTIAFQVYGRE
jgi:H+/Cl- antiporter ClcA